MNTQKARIAIIAALTVTASGLGATPAAADHNDPNYCGPEPPRPTTRGPRNTTLDPLTIVYAYFWDDDGGCLPATSAAYMRGPFPFVDATGEDAWRLLRTNVCGQLNDHKFYCSWFPELYVLPPGRYDFRYEFFSCCNETGEYESVFVEWSFAIILPLEGRVQDRYGTLGGYYREWWNGTTCGIEVRPCADLTRPICTGLDEEGGPCVDATPVTTQIFPYEYQVYHDYTRVTLDVDPYRLDARGTSVETSFGFTHTRLGDATVQAKIGPK